MKQKSSERLKWLEAFERLKCLGMMAVAVTFGAFHATARAQEVVVEAPPSAPAALSTVPVPLPQNLDDFIVNRDSAITLGKALFWDIQAGGDGRTACASCHFHAGADNRLVNTVAPRTGQFRGANSTLTGADFPFHRLAKPHKKQSDSNPVVSDTSEVVGSQGVVKKRFTAIVEGSHVDDGTLMPDSTFNLDGVNTRAGTGRNAPSVINAIFNDRQFWDGRANRFFNGVNPFGDMDPDARVWIYKTEGKKFTQKRIRLDNASLASQSVGPINNDVEMSWDGRTFPQVGRKMLSLAPLRLQQVHPKDSVLGKLASTSGPGLQPGVTYSELIKKAFVKKWWSSPEPTPDGFTHMEANFSLFWGLSIMMYESTLVSDDSPFDRYARGDDAALTEPQKAGLYLFLNQGKCINCHKGPEFTGAAISQLRGPNREPTETMIEFMNMAIAPEAFYDSGFYNIGVRPTAEDLGVGGSHPQFGPLSLTRRVQSGQSPDLNGQSIAISPGARVAVDGAFKTPTLRNVELTGPFMHNGGMKSLKEVVLFYARGADFEQQNIDNLDPDVGGIEEVLGDSESVTALVEFMKSLTDDRVRHQRAPFDHPELPIANGHSGVSGGIATDNILILPAVGRAGGASLKPFHSQFRE